MRPLAVLVLVLMAALAAPPAAGATPVLHAHRGGALVDGAPTTPENTLEAFADTARTPEVWLEMDTVVSADGVPYVIHDSTLDRTTNCSGAVVHTSSAVIDGCVVDTVGVSSVLRPVSPGAPLVRVPRLADALALAKAAGAPVNVEIKRIPGDPGYVPGDPAFARAVMAVVRAAALDPSKLIIQSFDPTNLDTARAELPGVQTSLLTLAVLNDVGPELAALRGDDWISPGGVPSQAFVERARALGLRVVPYTLNREQDVRAAAAAGVDAIITDDLTLARRALGLPHAAGPAPQPSTRTVRVSVTPRTRATALRRGGLRVVLTASQATRATVVARLDGRVVGRRTVVLRRAGRRVAPLRFTRAGRRTIARRRTVRLVLHVSVGDGRRPATRPYRLR